MYTDILPTCMSMQKPEDSIKFPGPGVIELINCPVGAGNPALVLWKNRPSPVVFLFLHLSKCFNVKLRISGISH